MKNNPRRNSIFVVAGIILAAGLLEAAVFGLINDQGISVSDSLLFRVPVAENLTRFILALFIIVTAILIHRAEKKRASSLQADKGKKVKEEESVLIMQKLIADLRIPMNSINGFTELLKQPQEDKLIAKSYLHNISTSSRFAVEMIDMLEDIYRISTKTMEFNQDRFDLNHVMDELASFMEEKKNEMGGTFVELKVLKGIRGSFHILADRKRIELILSSLIENSLKYTRRGAVSFGYEFTGKTMLRFFVRDTGRAPSQERMNYILAASGSDFSISDFPFDTFALKLVYADRVTRLMGGTFQATSHGSEETEYRLSLPYITDEKDLQPERLSVQEIRPTPEPEVQPAEEEHPVFENSRILVAEDNASNFILLQELLYAYKTELVWAKNGEEAVELVREDKDRFDLVLMDILMPKMDGYEAARLIKELNPGLPIVAQTAYSIENVRDKSVLQNFDAYLIKPIWTVNLRDVVTRFLKK
ncbi:MAG: hybrid sensor histidine kinase/response regulator [Bacteroidota bacterium]